MRSNECPSSFALVIHVLSQQRYSCITRACVCVTVNKVKVCKVCAGIILLHFAIIIIYFRHHRDRCPWCDWWTEKTQTDNIHRTILTECNVASYVTSHLLPVRWATCMARPRRYICIASRLSTLRRRKFLLPFRFRSCFIIVSFHRQRKDVLS